MDLFFDPQTVFEYSYLLIICGFFTPVSYCFWCRTISDFLNFPRLFTGTLTLYQSPYETKKREKQSKNIELSVKDFFYIMFSMVCMTLLISIPLYIFLSLLYPSIDGFFLSFLCGSFTIILLLISRISGFIGHVQIVTFLYLFAPILITLLWILYGLKYAGYNISNLNVPNSDFIIALSISSAVLISILEIFLFYEIKNYNKNIFKLFKFKPTLPWINLFSKLKEAPHYTDRKLLLNRVEVIIKSIKKKKENKLNIIWMTETVEEQIQRAIADFVKKDGTAIVRILCLDEGFKRDSEYKKYEEKNRIKTKVAIVEPGFFRAICINENVVIGLTTEGSPDSRRGFDAPPPLDWMIREFLELIFLKKSKKLKIMKI